MGTLREGERFRRRLVLSTLWSQCSQAVGLPRFGGGSAKARGNPQISLAARNGDEQDRADMSVPLSYSLAICRQIELLRIARIHSVVVPSKKRDYCRIRNPGSDVIIPGQQTNCF